jgi:hypothetical protein
MHTVKAILPGHSERLPERTPDIAGVFIRMSKFKKARYNDGLDTLKLAAWMNNIAAQAIRAKDFELALKRYFATIAFISECTEQNAYILTAGWDFDDDVEEKLDFQCFKAEIGLTESSIGLADWGEAARHIKVVMKDLQGRSGISKERKMSVKGLEQRIKKELGAAYDKAKGGEEPTAESKMAGLNLKTNANGKDGKAGGRQIGLHVYRRSG